MAEVSTSVLASREGLEEGDSSSLRLEMGLAASPQAATSAQWNVRLLLYVLFNFSQLRDFFLLRFKSKTQLLTQLKTLQRTPFFFYQGTSRDSLSQRC